MQHIAGGTFRPDHEFVRSRQFSADRVLYSQQPREPFRALLAPRKWWAPMPAWAPATPAASAASAPTFPRFATLGGRTAANFKDKLADFQT